jgi:myo-inositol 2-dehydrogenase / D-chiro-inositol 1-dehydrogenase
VFSPSGESNGVNAELGKRFRSQIPTPPSAPDLFIVQTKSVDKHFQGNRRLIDTCLCPSCKTRVGLGHRRPRGPARRRTNLSLPMLARVTLRYAVIGTGMMGCEHIANIEALAGCEVVAISDPDARSRSWARATLKRTVREYSDHVELLRDGDIDVVVVASPNMTHRRVLDDVLDTGVHVLVEKPLCTNVSDCEAVIARSLLYPSVLWMGLEYRWMPVITRLVSEVRMGTVGSVRMVAIREHRFPFLVKVGNWNRFSDNTGGTLVEKCCHFFDLMHLIVGERPIAVMASGAQDVNHLDEYYERGDRPDLAGPQRSDILDNAFVIVEYANGARASLDLCMFAEASLNEQELAVTGDRGKVEAFLPSGELRIGRRVPGELRTAVETQLITDDSVEYEGFHFGASYLEHRRLRDTILRNGVADVTLDDGLWSVATGVAAHRSIAEGRRVTLSEVLLDAAQPIR